MGVLKNHKEEESQEPVSDTGAGLFIELFDVVIYTKHLQAIVNLLFT